MTKDELINWLGKLLDIVDAFPDQTDIISATIQDPRLSKDCHAVDIHLHSNIGAVASKLGLQAEVDCGSFQNMTQFVIRFDGGEIVQLEPKKGAAPGAGSTGGSK